MPDEDWPFDDADQHDPLAALRIPVTGAHPGCGYLAAYAGQAEPLLRWPRPDEAEAAILASYIDYLRGKYPEYVQRRMLAQPLDTGDLSALVFAKRATGDWAYRRAHWTEGVFWWPLPEHCEGGRSIALVPLLDHVEKNGGTTEAPEWAAWKSEHPDIFGELTGKAEAANG